MAERLMQIIIVDKEIHKLLPAEATYSASRQAWFVGCPSENCGIGNLANHHAAYDEVSKQLTISPSILCGCGTHYFIEANQIRWC